MADTLGHAWMRGPVPTKEEFEKRFKLQVEGSDDRHQKQFVHLRDCHSECDRKR